MAKAQGGVVLLKIKQLILQLHLALILLAGAFGRISIHAISVLSDPHLISQELDFISQSGDGRLLVAVIVNLLNLWLDLYRTCTLRILDRIQ